MALFIMALLSLSATVVALGGATPAATQSTVHFEPPCHDWGQSGEGAVRVLDGEAGWLDCPLFSHPTVYNYSSALAAGLNLVWYHMATGQDLEQPIDFHHPDQRLSKERERLWLQPAAAQDTGQYICMLRNRTSCAKIAVHLEVVPRTQNSQCDMTAATPPQPAKIPIQGGKTLSCPDLPSSSHAVTWYYKCEPYPFSDQDREVQGNSLVVHSMFEFYQGPYFCVVTYESKGKTMNFTRMINVTAVSPEGLPKEPHVLNPDKEQTFTVKQGSEVRLQCKVNFPHLDGPKEIWWSIDGKNVDHLAPRITSTSRFLSYSFGDVIMENELRIRDFNSEDLTREYNCSARNDRGSSTRTAVLAEEVYLPLVQLGCGLGVTLAIMLALFVVYHVFWLELLLLYRSWFGTDERSIDNKEYDIYISYARNSEEEQFVLLTLRRVLENELGYTVCIFDRDSLPGGTITDETLSFVGCSRRLLVVLSPGYALHGTQALLELKAGLESMALGGHLRVILLQYKPLGRDDWVRELRRARVALVLVRWQGDKSSDLSSRFWKRLRVELPVRRVKDSQQSEGSSAIPLKTIHCHNSHNALEAILGCMQVSRRLLLVLSPDYLTEKSVSLTECRLGLYLQHTSRLRIITILYKAVPVSCTEALQLRHTTTTITWRGRRSEMPSSRFWKRLHLALPVRPLTLGRRLVDSTSSHSDLAALALQRQRTSTLLHRESKAVARGRGRQRKGQGHIRGERSKCRDGHSKTCRMCVGFRDPGVLCKATKLHQPLPNMGTSSCTAHSIDTANIAKNIDTANSLDTAKRRDATNGKDTAKSTETCLGLHPAPDQP